MRRKLDLAASVIVAPDLLFLDEPTTGLDPRSRSARAEELRGQRRAIRIRLPDPAHRDRARKLIAGDEIVVRDEPEPAVLSARIPARPRAGLLASSPPARSAWCTAPGSG